MVFDFAGRPPEINSALIYAGPGGSSDDGRRRRLEQPGRRIEHGSSILRVGDIRARRRRMAGSGLVGDGHRRRAVRGVAEYHCRRGRARRRAGRRVGGRVPERVSR